MHRALIALAAAVFTLSLVSAGRAQTPGATPGTDHTSAYPCRIVISGPLTSVVGAPIAYTLNYEWVAAPRAEEGCGLVLEGALVSVTAVRGAAPTGPGPRTPDSEDYTLNGGSGTLRVVVKPPGGPGLSGFGFYVRGTEIGYPDGTIDGATTLVALPGSMLITGEVPARVGEGVFAVAANLETGQTVICDSITSRPWKVPGPDLSGTPGSTPVTLINPSYFALVVAPSCVRSPSASLRICWLPYVPPPSPPPAIDIRPCYAIPFSAGVRGLRVLSPSAPLTSGGASPSGSRITLPNTGDGASAHGGPGAALALVVAALGGVALAGAGLLWQER